MPDFRDFSITSTVEPLRGEVFSASCLLCRTVDSERVWESPGRTPAESTDPATLDGRATLAARASLSDKVKRESERGRFAVVNEAGLIGRAEIVELLSFAERADVGDIADGEAVHSRDRGGISSTGLTTFPCSLMKLVGTEKPMTDAGRGGRSLSGGDMDRFVSIGGEEYPIADPGLPFGITFSILSNPLRVLETLVERRLETTNPLLTLFRTAA